MLERFIELKLIESKETAVKRLARKMLERFRARFKRSEKVAHIEEPIPSPAPVVAEEVKIAAKEAPGVAAEPPQLEESETIVPSVPETKIETKPEEREEKTDKGTFESVTTNNYFKGWDEDVKLEGNPEIKAQIRKNIIEAEKINQIRYEHAAADLGVSVEEFKARLQAKIEDMVERANFFRATQVGTLDKIMNVDGRWKSQFETGTSQGMLNPRYRAAVEMRMFGFNRINGSEIPTETAVPEEALKTNKEKRPIYGYFSDEEHGAINYQGKIPPLPTCLATEPLILKLKKKGHCENPPLLFTIVLVRQVIGRLPQRQNLISQVFALAILAVVF